MKTIVDKNNGILDILVIGRLDTVTAPQFRTQVSKVDFSDVQSLIMDFSDLQYISSSGLRELLSLKKRMGKKPFRIEHVSPDVEDIFNVTGFSSLFDYTVDKEDVDYSMMSFGDFIAQKAKSTPNAVFIKDGAHSYSWEDIDRISCIIASDLYRLGVRKGSHVAICSVNSVNWICTFFAIQRLGALACLLNFNLVPAEIIKLSIAGDITFLCYSALPQMKEGDGFIDSLISDYSPIEKTYCIDKSVSFYDRPGEYDPSDRSWEAKMEADDACTMVYTSGSTGVPKGVLLSAYNILNASGSNVRSLRLTENDTACVMLPLFHIFGLVAGLFANAIAGSTIVLPVSLKTDVLLSTIRDERCTVFHSVPTMLIALINNKNFRKEDLATLRSTILSGALANESQIRELMSILPGNHFATSYGLSEMAPVSITDYDDTKEHIEQTIGKPVEGIDIRIYDNEKNAVCPANVSGEIQVQGFNLMLCYYKVALEQQSIDEDGWLHTGDLGFIDDDGYIHFAGRLKDIIVRGGENIYPREIAETIAEEDEVSDVVVVGVPDDFWGETVAAAIVLKSGMTFDEASMRDRLSRKLARYKLPADYVIYESFPSLPNGKIDMVNLRKEVAEKVAAKKTT